MTTTRTNNYFQQMVNAERWFEQEMQRIKEQFPDAVFIDDSVVIKVKEEDRGSDQD